MNFEGFQPQSIPRFGSKVQADDVTELPLGIASDVQNCQYRAQSVGPRDGTGAFLRFGEGNAVKSVGALRYLAADNSGQENISIVACTGDGNIWIAPPIQGAAPTLLTTDAMVAAAGLTRMATVAPQCQQAYNKMLIAQGNLMTGTAPALIVDGATQTCDPVSDKPIGDTWLPQTRYRAGQIVSPSGDSATNLYYCLEGGISALAEPIWPTIEGATVVDGSGVGNVTWRQLTILCTSGLEPPPAALFSSAPAGPLIPAGATFFLVCTWINQFGESTANVVNPDGTLGSVLRYKNTTSAAVNLSVILPLIPADIAALPPQYAILGCNLYGYLATATPNAALYLDPSSYAMIAGSTPGATITVSAVPVGSQLPQTNTAYTTDAGNVASGTRYMIVLYQTRTGYITGFSGPAPIRCDITVDGRKMLVQNLPIGAYNCAARICAFTVSGQSSAGPYRYIYKDDFEDPGLGQAKILQTATRIPDNTTTSAYFDFLDSYLVGASDVTDYFDRIEVPAAADAYFAKGINRVVYGGCVGYPSAFLVSDLEDPEAVRVPGSIVQVSQTDGDRAVCWRESGTLQVAYKENSAHAVTPNDGDPSTWAVNELWRGAGPCGARAIDVATADGEKMTAFAHRTGGYIWDGSGAPTLLTKALQGTPEHPGDWDRINWAASANIRVCINMKERLVYFFVPMGAATENTTRITLNAFYGLDDEIIFIQRTGKEVPNVTGRKWSIDAIAANDAVYLPQRTSDAA